MAVMAAASSEVRGWTNDHGSFAGVLFCLADCVFLLLCTLLVRAITEHFFGCGARRIRFTLAL